MSKITAIIVDDEFFNRELVASLILSINPAYEIVGQAESVKEGYKLITRLKPDVVFLDIKMPDGSGFELLGKFDRINFEVVFVTGFDEYALKAFEFNALDYILKPIDRDKFSVTLERVEARINKKSDDRRSVDQILQTYKESIITKIPVHHNDKVILLSIDEIISLHSNEGCTEFRMFPMHNRYISSKQFSDFEFILSNFNYMIRINKSTFINLNYIESYTKGLGCFITMKDGNVLEVSRRKKTEILDKLEQTRLLSK